MTSRTRVVGAALRHGAAPWFPRVALASLLLLASCGGGGGGGGEAKPLSTTASPAAGVYASTQSVTLSADRPATIHYSLDGNMPSVGGANTLSAPSPVSGIQVSSDTTLLQFFGVDAAGNREPVKSQTYVVRSGAASGPGDAQDLYPLQVGNSWRREVRSTETGSPPATYNVSLDVTGTSVVNGVTALVTRESGGGTPSGEVEEYLLETSRGITCLGNDDPSDRLTAQLVPYPVAVFPVQPGAGFVQFDRAGLDLGEDLDLDGKVERADVRTVVTVKPPESVTVPAGTFGQCIRTETESVATVILSSDRTRVSLKTVQTLWIAPGIGPVKSLSEATSEGYAASESQELIEAVLLTRLLGPAAVFPAGSFPQSVAVGDLDGDGRLDLAVANQGDPSLGFADAGVSVLLGDGTGSFGVATTLRAGTYAIAVAIADLNGDGKQDLAVANFGGPSVSILLGNGDGTFGAATDLLLTASMNATSIVARDLSGDGKPDLAVTLSNGFSNITPGHVSVLLGNGDGTFGAPADFAVGGTPMAMATGDFDGDGRPDLVVANTLVGSVSVLLGDGAGSFGPALELAVGLSEMPASVAAADFDGDGHLDLALASNSHLTNDANVSILLGTGSGSFAAPVRHYVDRAQGAYLHAVTCGDLDADGKMDVVVAKERSGPGPRGDNLSILLGDGTGALSPVVRIAPLGVVPASVDVADLDGDGRPDLAVTTRDGVTILLDAAR
jgi:hypothetical protein